MVDVSIVVTFRDERIATHQSLSAIERMRRYAFDKGSTSELVIVLDRSDAETKAIIQNHLAYSHQAKMIEVGNGDVGLSRNDGIRAASGKIICLVGAESYHSKNWIERCVHELAQVGNKNIVLHPEWIVNVGTQTDYFRQFSQNKSGYDTAGLIKENYWQASACAQREIFEQIPYGRDTAASTGFGDEIWCWNCETLAARFIHNIVSGTAEFIRHAEIASPAVKPIIRPTRLFDANFAASFFQGAVHEKRS